MTPSGLSDDFVDWASSQMRGLVDARHRDALAGQHDLPSFFALLDTVMNEYSSHAFARPDFVGNLDQPGSHSHTVDSLRERAMQFFLHNAAPGGVTRNAVPPSPPLSTPSAQELWAATDKQRLHALTCKALGIPTATNEADLPAAFTPQYNLLVRQEFDLLLEHERAQWCALARDHQLAVDRGEMDLIAVQDRQQALFSWFTRIAQMEMSSRFGGIAMVVAVKGFGVGAENLKSITYRGQAHSYLGAARWHRTSGYLKHVAKYWAAFVDNEVEGELIFELSMLPDAGGDLQTYRAHLKLFFEQLLRMQCNMDVLDSTAFWRDVEANPSAYVSPNRLPAGVIFENPLWMPEDRFRALYTHVRCCHVDRKAIHPMARFVYEPKIIAQYIALQCAISLKVQQSEDRDTVRERAGTSPTKEPVAVAVAVRPDTGDALNPIAAQPVDPFVDAGVYLDVVGGCPL